MYLHLIQLSVTTKVISNISDSQFGCYHNRFGDGRHGRQPLPAAIEPAITEPEYIPSSEHGIDKRQISSGCLSTIARLQQAGYTAYLVGGAVRDLLLGRVPKDFDVATSATPEQVRRVFHRCRLIGRRFRLAHVYAGMETIEVATFRGSGNSDTHTEHEHLIQDGRIVRDNVFGSEHEDAVRRDFTANALFYEPGKQQLIDYVGGYTDLKQRRLRLIGDAQTRYREDPVRMLRAVRFASSRNLSLADSVNQPIPKLAHLLSQVPPARLFDEVCKLMLSGTAYKATCNLVKYQLFTQLFPDIQASIDSQHLLQTTSMLISALHNTDKRVAQELPVTPGFLFAVLLWEPLQLRITVLLKQNLNHNQAMIQASQELLFEQSRTIALPRRFGAMCREIWVMQHRFRHICGKRAISLFTEVRFRAAYDFLLLRAEQEPEFREQAEWWSHLQTLNPEQQRKKMGLPPASNNNGDDKVHKKRSSRRKRKRPKTDTAPNN